MGRKKINPENKKAADVKIRLSVEQKVQLEDYCERKATTQSTLVRKIIQLILDGTIKL
jgi:predicted DNA-binding protein